MTAALALLRRFWWAIPIAALSVLLLLTRAQRDDARAQRDDARHTLDNERAAWTAEIDRADKARIAAERDYAVRLATAADGYAARVAARAPIIIRSTDTVREYAKTAAGRAVCLGADRVRGIDALDAELADDPAPTDRGGSAVPPDASAAPAGR